MQKVGSKMLAQCRGTICLEANFLVMVQKFAGEQMSVSGLGLISICHTGRSKSKNRDKQLTFIVRVRFSKRIFSITKNTRFPSELKSPDISEIVR